ncbi:hypothetical protein Cgig2_004988 [Carnegiea gigantea]|uniref:Uncharacterized protein n=1 Tax=Carnegiea gigantea TaxID=171969 RepID=A0A9Q1QSA3_9CARY|nr:hypothetical protein Cgig2_004988 [Carnegiea gigantea]
MVSAQSGGIHDPDLNMQNTMSRRGSVHQAVCLLVWNKPQIAVLLETHISGDRAEAVCRQSGHDSWHRSEADEFQGRIWILWNSHKINIVIRRGWDTSWTFTAIYAYLRQQEREVLWNEVQQFGAAVQQPWLPASDFNETVNLKKRNHEGVKMLRRCGKFKNWIENNGLIDLGFSGHKFTWVKGNTEATQKCTRLDRALCNAEWRTQFQEGSVQHLLRNYSNHLPLLISTSGFAFDERSKAFPLPSCMDYAQEL